MEEEKMIEMLAANAEASVYLMGFSFILGSLFTILILLALDFMRRNKNPDGSPKE